ncbi:MAG: FtsQ-type POTRA domain-containing protein [Candidatus Promineofilum sp.]|nr:FtsQ-type POTRA domain-containing protein [Promineifilum sp.]
MNQRKEQPKQRLRKQPRMRRIQATTAAPLPDLATPEARSARKTAAKRKRRNSQQRIRRPIAGVMAVVLNTRWISLAVLGVCAYTLFLIGGDDRFYLNYIPVEGATSLDINHIVAESGLAGRHIFAADPQEAADRLGQVGGVITASVTLHWPNDVSIILREKPPLATWQEGEEAYWVDEDGGLSPARAQTVGLLNIISEVTSDKAEVTSDELRATSEEAEVTSDEATDDEPTTTDAVDAQVAFVPRDVLAGALQLRALRPNIDKLYYRPSGGLSYQDGRGWRAYFGVGQDMNQKLVVYETVVAQLMERGIRPEYISVSNQYKPYYRAVP